MSTAVQRDRSAQVRESVEQEISTLFARHSATARAYGSDFLHLWSLAADHMQGGKLVRPLLLLKAHDALTRGSEEGLDKGIGHGADGHLRDEALTIAAGVELLHYSFLLHDDVIDGDVVRRGRANLIGELATTSADHAGDDGAEHWAHTGAILMGDLLLSATHQLFARLDVPQRIRTRLLDLLEHTIVETTAGEYADVGLSHGVITPDLSTVLTMTTRKTATYTFELPLRAAAILAGGSQELEGALSVAGSHLGLAYQLQDDLLSTFGNSEVHGKDPYSDLREGKQTAIVCFARMTSAWPSLEPNFGDPHLSTETAEQMRALLIDCGAQRFVEGLIQEQLTAFYEVLAGGSTGEAIPGPLRTVLLDVATRLEDRQS